MVMTQEEAPENMTAPVSPTYSSARPSLQQPNLSPIMDSNIDEAPSRTKAPQRQQPQNQSTVTTKPHHSKGDRRRGAPIDRFRDLSATFNNTKDAQFRKQIHGLQVEMALIASANPYGIEPLNDTPAEVGRLVEDVKVNAVGGKTSADAPGITASGAASAPGSATGPVTSAPPRASRSSSPPAATTGKWYSRFLQEANRTKEERDAELAALMVR